MKQPPSSAVAGWRITPRVRRNRLQRQKGLSLIELMIGITIGLLVSLAALGALTFSRVSATTVSDTVRLQQDASVAMRMIGHQLRQARAVALQEIAVFADVASVSYAAYTGVTPPGAPPGGADEVAVYGVNGAAFDSFTVSFSASPSVASTNCMGVNTLAPGTNTIASSFDVVTASLRCRGLNADIATPAPANAVIDNVEDMQVWYGVRDAANNIRYITANQVGVLPWPTNLPPTVAWSNVGAIMVCLRLAGTSRTNPTAPPVGAELRGCQDEVIPWDGRFQRVFRQVFTLRNPA